MSVIKPKISPTAEVRKGDILIYHTGYHQYFNGGPEEDEERYFLRHPGGDREFAEWLVEMEFAWTGFDCGSGDNPMNTSIRYKRPDALEQYEKQIGKDVNEVFPEEDLFVMHKVPFAHGVTHVENIGGDIDRLRNALPDRRFPHPYRGGRGVALPRRRLRRGLRRVSSRGRAAAEAGSFADLAPEEVYPGVCAARSRATRRTVTRYRFEAGASSRSTATPRSRSPWSPRAPSR